jgi:mRNA interferase YafQ
MAKPRPPLIAKPTAKFKRDLKRQVQRGRNPEKLYAVIVVLCARRPLPKSLQDHALTGEGKGWRDCHLEPDWLLIYRTTETELVLGRTGTHSDLF